MRVSPSGLTRERSASEGIRPLLVALALITISTAGCGRAGCSDSGDTAADSTSTKAEAPPPGDWIGGEAPKAAEPAKPSPPARPAATKAKRTPAPSVPGKPWPAFHDQVKDRIKTEITDGNYTGTVTAPWGEVVVNGAEDEEGVAGTAARYWTAFSTADFEATYAFATGTMYSKLGSYDHEAGYEGFTDSISARMTTNPVVNIRVDTVNRSGDTTAGVIVTMLRQDGTEEKKETLMKKTNLGWRVDSVRRAR